MQPINYTPLDLSQFNLKNDHHHHVAAVLAVFTGIVFVISGLLMYPKLQHDLTPSAQAMENTPMSTSTDTNPIPKLTIPFDKWVTIRNSDKTYEFKIPFPDFQQTSESQVESNSRGERIEVSKTNFVKNCQEKNDCTVYSQKTVANNDIQMTKYNAKDKNNNEFVAYNVVSKDPEKEFTVILSSVTTKENASIPSEDEELFDKIMSSFKFL